MKRLVVTLTAAVVLVGAQGASAEGSSPMAEYERAWDNLSGYYGATGQPAPLVRFSPTPGAIAYTVAGPGGVRMVTLGEVAEADLRIAAAGNGWRQHRARVSNRRTLAHEWTHVFQSAELMQYYPLNASLVEHQARLMARRVENAVRGKRGPAGNPRAFARRIFRENYGVNPRLIRWPGA